MLHVARATMPRIFLLREASQALPPTPRGTERLGKTGAYPRWPHAEGMRRMAGRHANRQAALMSCPRRSCARGCASRPSIDADSSSYPRQRMALPARCRSRASVHAGFAVAPALIGGKISGQWPRLSEGAATRGGGQRNVLARDFAHAVLASAVRGTGSKTRSRTKAC
jgi:hypothetical protein